MSVIPARLVSGSRQAASCWSMLRRKAFRCSWRGLSLTVCRAPVNGCASIARGPVRCRERAEAEIELVARVELLARERARALQDVDRVLLRVDQLFGKRRDGDRALRLCRVDGVLRLQPLVSNVILLHPRLAICVLPGVRAVPVDHE